jgi:hypothetical protein
MRLKNDTDLRMLRLQLGKDLARAIPRAIVHADEFDLEGNGQNPQDNLPECGAFVIYRHYDGKFHGVIDGARFLLNPS